MKYKLTIGRVLYGLKSIGAGYFDHIPEYIEVLGYKSCLSDAYVWLKPEVRSSVGHKYYSYILFYVDDVLCIFNGGVSTIEHINK